MLVSRKPQELGTARDLDVQHPGRLGRAGDQVIAQAATTPPQQRLNFLGAVASPDGKYFYYARRTGSFSYNATFPLWQIVRRDRTTGDEDVITTAPGSAFRPVLSPDGKQAGVRHSFRYRNRACAFAILPRAKRPLAQVSGAARRSGIRAPRATCCPAMRLRRTGKESVVFYGGKINRVQVATGESTDIPFTAKVSLDLGPQLKFASRVEEGPGDSAG